MNLTDEQKTALNVGLNEWAGNKPWWKCPNHSEVLGPVCPWCSATVTHEDFEDYSDLNAINRLEKRLTDEERRKYMDELCDIVTNPERIYPWNWCDLDTDDWFAMVNASAEQRAIALARTVNIQIEGVTQ